MCKILYGLQNMKAKQSIISKDQEKPTILLYIPRI